MSLSGVEISFVDEVSNLLKESTEGKVNWWNTNVQKHTYRAGELLACRGPGFKALSGDSGNPEFSS